MNLLSAQSAALQSADCPGKVLAGKSVVRLDSNVFVLPKKINRRIRNGTPLRFRGKHNKLVEHIKTIDWFVCFS